MPMDYHLDGRRQMNAASEESDQWMTATGSSEITVSTGGSGDLAGRARRDHPEQGAEAYRKAEPPTESEGA